MKKKPKRKPVNNRGAKGANVGSNGAGPPTIHFLDRNLPTSWYLLPLAVARIREFPRKYPSSDADGDTLARWVEEDFVREKPTTLVVAAERDGKVVGHLFAAIMTNGFLGGAKYLHVMQVENDVKAGIPRDLERAIVEQVMEWGRMHEAQWSSLETDDPNLAQRYEDEFEFKPRRIAMRRNL